MFIESRRAIAGCGKNIVAAAALTVAPVALMVAGDEL